MDERMNRMAQQLGAIPPRCGPDAVPGRAGSDADADPTGSGRLFAAAVQSAARGDTAEMAQMVQKLMQSPDGAELIDRINQATRK